MSCVTHHTCPQSKSRKLAFKEVEYLQSYSAMTVPGFKPSMAECLSPTASWAELWGLSLGLPELK